MVVVLVASWVVKRYHGALHPRGIGSPGLHPRGTPAGANPVISPYPAGAKRVPPAERPEKEIVPPRRQTSNPTSDKTKGQQSKQNTWRIVHQYKVLSKKKRSRKRKQWEMHFYEVVGVSTVHSGARKLRNQHLTNKSSTKKRDSHDTQHINRNFIKRHVSSDQFDQSDASSSVAVGVVIHRHKREKRRNVPFNRILDTQDQRNKKNAIHYRKLR